MQKKELPVGIDDFGKLRKEDFYYIDKTGLIRDLLSNWGEVNLFTRPRRFGKTLNMSMLKYPVIFLSLKSVDGLTDDLAMERLKTIIQEEAMRLHGILKDEFLSPFDRKMLSQMENREISEKEIPDSLNKQKCR